MGKSQRQRWRRAVKAGSRKHQVLRAVAMAKQRKLRDLAESVWGSYNHSSRAACNRVLYELRLVGLVTRTGWGTYRPTPAGILALDGLGWGTDG